MNSRRYRDLLRVRILETERLLEGVSDHPIMSFSFKQKLDSLKKELENLPLNPKEPTITLLFSGRPVFGSVGIDASFLSRAILPFQKMVEADLAQRSHGIVGKRGTIRSADKANLFLTALPRGSFGVELSKIDDSIEEGPLADSLAHVSQLIDSSAKSDEDFAVALGDASPRTINGLRQFLKIVSDDDAGVTIESGGIRTTLEVDSVKTAYERVAEATTSQADVEIRGILKGILLESWRFDFVDLNQHTITGPIDPSLSEERVIEYMASSFNKECIAVFQKTSVYLKNGRIKETFLLKELHAEVR